MIRPAPTTILPLLAATLLALAASPPAAAQERTLDPRIDDARITRSDLPPLPEEVLLPLPPDHRVAGRVGQVPISAAHFDRATAAIDAGLAALAALQDASGGWMIDARSAPSDDPDAPSPVAVAVTALALKATVQARGEGPRPDRDRALAFVLRASEEDGSFGGGALANYVAATVTSALAGLPEPAMRERTARAVRWLQQGQWDDGEGLEPAQDWYGGAGYGTHGRPDLSNTQTMLDALYDAGLSPDEPAFQRALVFVSRAQNLRATNGAAWSGDDGGFVYTPANGGESMASEAAGEGRRGENLPEDAPPGLRSYGSMTYAGFKSLLYAGLSPDDVRVRAAFDWIRTHWTFTENPGLGAQGHFYYLHALARALRVAQQHEVADRDGTVHDWREELIDALVALQREDGSWRNDADRWLEGEAPLATAYALLALEEAIKPVVFGPEDE